MPILELIIELLSSFTLPNPNSTGWITDDLPKGFPKDIKPETTSDIMDCAKAHQQIEKGSSKSITPVVKYSEYYNEENGRKTLAGQIKIPYHTVRACVTSKNIDKPADTGKVNLVNVKAVRFCC